MYGRRRSSVFSTSITFRICGGNISIDIHKSSLRVCSYMDRPKAGTMSGSHILVEGFNGICPGQLTVLLVHVVGAGARIVADPDAEVLNLLRALLVDLDIMH
jgi:hypothetical protein